jgi:hypothetical protein
MQVLKIWNPGDDAKWYPAPADEPNMRQNMDIVGSQQRSKEWHHAENTLRKFVSKPRNGIPLQ